MNSSGKKKITPKAQEEEPEDDEMGYMDKEISDKKKQIENIHLDDRKKEKYAYLMFCESKEKKERYKVKKEINF